MFWKMLVTNKLQCLQCSFDFQWIVNWTDFNIVWKLIEILFNLIPKKSADSGTWVKFHLSYYLCIDSNFFFYFIQITQCRFEEKYHPTKGKKRQRFIRDGHRRRLRIFLDLWEQGFIDELSLQITYSPAVLKLLDRGKQLF